jgi:hypothetical protein
MLIAIMLGVIMLNDVKLNAFILCVCDAGCGCHNIECHNAKCHNVPNPNDKS